MDRRGPVSQVEQAGQKGPDPLFSAFLSVQAPMELAGATTLGRGFKYQSHREILS